MNKLLVVGGSGALGRSIVNTFKKETATSSADAVKNWNIMNIDFVSNDKADGNFIVEDNLSENDIHNIYNVINDTNDKFDCIVNVAGGWCGGGIKDNSIVESVRQMTNMNVLPSVLTAHLATKYLKRNSLLVFTGANIIKNQLCPLMLGYDLSKSSTHRLVDMLVTDSNTSNEQSLLPQKSKIIAILPNVIYTENNRKAMPEEDFTKWTNPDDISKLIRDWAEKTKDYPRGTYFAV